MLEIGNPILTLRRYFSNGREKEARRTRAITSFTMLNAGVRAWNAWSSDVTMMNIAWKNHNIPELIKPKKARSSEA
jgi:hypothetical protein